MSSLPVSVSCKSMQDERTTKNESFGIGNAISTTIVIWILVESTKPLLDTFHSNSALISLLPNKLDENGVFDEFCRLKRPRWRDPFELHPGQILWLMQW